MCLLHLNFSCSLSQLSLSCNYKQIVRLKRDMNLLPLFPGACLFIFYCHAAFFRVPKIKIKFHADKFFLPFCRIDSRMDAFLKTTILNSSSQTSLVIYLTDPTTFFFYTYIPFIVTVLTVTICHEWRLNITLLKLSIKSLRSQIDSSYLI